MLDVQKTEMDIYCRRETYIFLYKCMAFSLHTSSWKLIIEKLLAEDVFYFLGILSDYSSTKCMWLTLIKSNVGNRRKFCCRALSFGWLFFSFLKAWCSEL